ncbi:hypothetical protein Lal_00042515 [Lupinus albus]|nr:hypothetical protein Lal_00042515 [Lupinus albus]
MNHNSKERVSMVSHTLRKDPIYPKTSFKGKKRFLRRALAQASLFLLKRENPAHFKNSILTLSLKRGSSTLHTSLPRTGKTNLAQARILQHLLVFHPQVSHLSPRRDPLAQARIWQVLQFSPPLNIKTHQNLFPLLLSGTLEGFGGGNRKLEIEGDRGRCGTFEEQRENLEIRKEQRFLAGATPKERLIVITASEIFAHHINHVNTIFKLFIAFNRKEWDEYEYYDMVVVVGITNLGSYNRAADILKVFEPIVKVLRMVDGDTKPTMGFLYEAIDRAKQSIQKHCCYHSQYNDIVNKRWKFMHSDLHSACMLLIFLTRNSNMELNMELCL